MEKEKVQLINGTWHFFHGARMLDLGIGPNQPPSVSSAKALEMRADKIEAFRKECAERKKNYFKPND